MADGMAPVSYTHLGNESVFSREMNTREKALLGMDIVRLTLERSETAADAVRIVGELMERYGQGGNASFDTVFHYDNAYMIMDEREIWHVETAGKHYWAAKRVDGAYSISNYLSICTPDRMHGGLIENAVRKGYPVDEPFDFAKAYVDWSSPVNRSGMLRRCCSYQMANKHANHFNVEHMVETLRAHYSEAVSYTHLHRWNGAFTIKFCSIETLTKSVKRCIYRTKNSW